MKIFLCGAQGVGKSTLVADLPSRYKLEKKDSFSKKFLAENPLIQTSANSKYDEFQDKILLYCLSQYINDKNFISSRSIIDSFAYISANDSEKKIPLMNILNHYREYLLTEDDIYIYLPVEFPISLDNNENRNIDIEYQQKVDEQMQRYFNNLRGLNTPSQFYILTGGSESRLKSLIKIIEEKEKSINQKK